MKEINFELLEKKLNVAASLVEELDIANHTISIVPDVCTDVTVINDKDNNEVFSLETLKSDFIMIRQNVMKLIVTGQRVLDSASVLDIGDLKPMQLTALSTLQQTLGSNLKLMVGIYKEICEIEKMRIGISGKTPEGTVQQLNSGNTITNNIVFSGDTSSLLDIIKENHK